MPTDRRRLHALGWTAAVTILLLAPVPALFGELGPDELGLLPLDKLVHVALFVPLAWAWLDAAGVARRLSVRGAAPFVLLLAWGAAVELLQQATSWRHGEWADLAADAAGLLLGYLTPRWWPFSSLRRKREGPPDA